MALKSHFAITSSWSDALDDLKSHQEPSIAWEPSNQGPGRPVENHSGPRRDGREAHTLRARRDGGGSGSGDLAALYVLLSLYGAPVAPSCARTSAPARVTRNGTARTSLGGRGGGYLHARHKDLDKQHPHLRPPHPVLRRRRRRRRIRSSASSRVCLRAQRERLPQSILAS
jgi:hypothetical protein